MHFEWNPSKAAMNLAKHRVSFHEAATVFGDSLSITVPDPDHSFDEDRYLTIGMSNRSRLLIVGHTERGELIRIISPREIAAAEREASEKRRH